MNSYFSGLAVRKIYFNGQQVRFATFNEKLVYCSDLMINVIADYDGYGNRIIVTLLNPTILPPTKSIGIIGEYFDKLGLLIPDGREITVSNPTIIFEGNNDKRYRYVTIKNVDNYKIGVVDFEQELIKSIIGPVEGQPS